MSMTEEDKELAKTLLMEYLQTFKARLGVVCFYSPKSCQQQFDYCLAATKNYYLFTVGINVDIEPMIAKLLAIDKIPALKVFDHEGNVLAETLQVKKDMFSMIKIAFEKNGMGIPRDRISPGLQKQQEQQE